MRGRITRRGCRQGAVNGKVRPEAPRDEECLVSTLVSGLEDVVFNDFIKDDFIPALKVMVKSRQVLHPFLTL